MNGENEVLSHAYFIFLGQINYNQMYGNYTRYA